jgi:phage terminase large subunit-like protein
MRPYIDWIEDSGFVVRQYWDFEKEKMVRGSGRIGLFDHQKHILGHCLTPDEDGRFPYETIIYSCPKKSGKTAIAASIGCYFGEEAPEGSEIYTLANDLEQAEGRAMREMKFHSEKSGLETTKYRIDYPGGSFIQVLSSHYTSAAGAHQTLTLWDELWGYTSEKSTRLWEEMTPIPTEENSMRVVVTYAGFENESELLWELYESTVLNGIRLADEFPDLPCYTSKDGSVFAYWDNMPRMPWQTPEYYERQMQTLRPMQFFRLHRNEWGTSEDKFIPVEWWDKAAELEAPLQYMPDSPFYRYPVYVGVDVGVKHDSSAVVGVYYDYHLKEMGLAFARIWEPTGKEILDLEETVESYLRQMYSELNVQMIWADPTHFYRSITGLRKEGLPIDEFTQTGSNMMAASAALYEALQYEKLKVFRDADMREHLKFTTAKPMGSGFRIVKSEETRRAIDGTVALAIAVYNAIQHGGIDTSQEIKVSSPFSDNTGHSVPEGPTEKVLPQELGGEKNWAEYPPELRPDNWSNQ